MVKLSIEYKRKPSVIVFLDDRSWLASVDNLVAAGLLSNAQCLWAWPYDAATDDDKDLPLWHYKVSGK